MTFHKQLFNRQALSVGWSMLWRTWLAAVVLKIAFSVPVGFWYSFHRPSATDPAALRAHFDRILDISSLPAFVVLIPVFGWIGRSVLRKRNLPVPAHFVGWALFWRAMGLSVALGVAIGMLIGIPVAFWFRSGWVNTLAPFFMIAAIFTVAMYSYGWATLHVSRMAAPATGTAN